MAGKRLRLSRIPREALGFRGDADRNAYRRGRLPGLNAVIRAVVRKGIDAYGDELIGFRDGWRGVLEESSRS